MTSNASISNHTIGQLVAQKPQRGRVFEQLGIDYCCGGRKTLQDVCDQKGLDLRHVCSLIDACDAAPSVNQTDWNSVPLSQLIHNIKSTHHQFMRTELERTGALVKKVASVHGRPHPELVELERIFDLFAQELIPHMYKEESVLFPWIQALSDGDLAADAGMPSLAQPVRILMEEHDAAGDLLHRMRTLMHDYVPPVDACGTYRVMLDALRDMEHDMHQHVHKENNILFPRARALEKPAVEAMRLPKS